MDNVVVTGISGYLGTQVLKILDQDQDVKTIVGIDIRPPGYSSSKLKFYSRDVRKPLVDIFTENKVDSAFHLAFVVPPHSAVDAHGINIGGSQSFLNACEAAGVEALFYQSSHTVYGPHADNPPLISEDQPLRPVKEFPYGDDKKEVDLMFQEYGKAHPKQSVTIVRTVAAVGPEAGPSGLNVLFMPVTMYVRGFDPGWQFVHEKDLARMDVTLVKERKSGIYNAGAEGSVKFREMLGLTGKPSLGLPGWLWAFLVRVSWKLHIQRMGQAGGFEYFKHPIVLSTEKLAKTTNFRFTMNSREALMSYVDANMAGRKGAKRGREPKAGTG